MEVISNNITPSMSDYEKELAIHDWIIDWYEGLDEVTVRGTVFDNLDEHGWNMVKLDEEWYCVDLSWNDIVGVDAVSQHWYFNVTSDLMRKTDHHWDKSNVPEARGTTYRWQPAER